jgi:hypothetical protein
MVLLSLPDNIRYLMDANVYPHRVNDVHLLQTHISYILFAGDFVYKWKKPVDLGFLNFSTIARRRYYCAQELLLNRRLCPEVYLDLIALRRNESGFHFCGTGKIIDYGVKMLRLPQERMMNRLIEQGSLQRTDIEAIVARLVPFYEQCQVSPRITNCGSSREVGKNVLENLRQIECFIGKKGLDRRRFERIYNFTKKNLTRDKLFVQRMEQGRVRDCHGDLHTANICLTDKVAIFDCIEFNRFLRYSDVAADIAFLAMDLDFHGLQNLSVYFIEHFKEVSGDGGFCSLLNFYKCYRACVRGKVNYLTAADPYIDRHVARQCLDKAADCFALAEAYTSC